MEDNLRKLTEEAYLYSREIEAISRDLRGFFLKMEALHQKYLEEAGDRA